MSSAWASVVLAAALVVVTIGYTVQTARMAREMQESRLLSIRPKLTLDMWVLAGTSRVPVIVVTNLGPGAALEADLVLAFHPAEGTGQQKHRRWKINLIPAGQCHEFLPPKGSDRQPLDLDHFTRQYACVSLSGTVKDALGHTSDVHERLEGLEEHWELLKSSDHLVPRTEGERVVRGLQDLRRGLEKEGRRWRAYISPRDSRTDQESGPDEAESPDDA